MYCGPILSIVTVVLSEYAPEYGRVIKQEVFVYSEKGTLDLSVKHYEFSVRVNLGLDVHT
jgi:hypothetical protein